MLNLDEVLSRKGLSYDQLTPVERETYHQMEEALGKGQLTLSMVKEAIQKMKYDVESALVDEPERKGWRLNRAHLFLKARLKNYLLIEALLTSPERAEKEMERQLEGMIGRA